MTSLRLAFLLAVSLLLPVAAARADDDPKALVAVVGDADARDEERHAAAAKLAAMGDRAAPAVESMGDALVGHAAVADRGRDWNGVPEKARGPELLAPLLAKLGGPGLAQLRRALRTQNPHAIVVAARAVGTLGAKGAQAVPDLLAALGYVPDEHLMSLHWHPWQPYAYGARSVVLAALAAIGPAAKDAVPTLRAMLRPPDPPGVRGSVHALNAFLALAAIVPEDPAPLADVLAAYDARRLPLADAQLPALDPWLAKLGADSVPLLTRLVDADFSKGALDRLAALGEPAHGALVSRLRNPAALRGPWEGVLDSMTRNRCFPAAAVPVVAERYSTTLRSGGERACVPWLAGAGDAGEAAAFEVLRGFGWNSVYWALLRERDGAFGERLSRRWLASRRESADPWREDGGRPARTREVGGSGGGEFTATGRVDLVGIDVGLGAVNWIPIVRSVAPVFRSPEHFASGPRNGARDLKTQRLLAKDGYAVGGLLVAAADERLAGLAVVFLRKRDDGRLDPDDGYVSPWIGRAGDDPASPCGPVVVLGCDGRPVAGLIGRAGADVDALGLVAR
jgi:hypothetical protein